MPMIYKVRDPVKKKQWFSASHPQARKMLLEQGENCLLYTSPSPRDGLLSRMPSSA